ncbi:MAG: precorrin-6y C5,15-methyltransferase (decarboxylating) subunit CbiE [Magnetococcales bacterium]|nr:precorrin-6y C5,15-methyltransferase (decarboxylating) subunit CbiE [Magnetococcales bacterium]MBF0148444.1 precorrin-6y C5,15-methyltransferase (decarboxylating) subunit CbiE [Magnetococcales bacterium]MBF0174734.1 precorrin-6y C5,15-methyltransferase (decarboxylating) subunit CbiE [Magnetococcales bacterium]MBF0346306.1 precorrin-6y C5,15-methyltransferase (decarboxylating) subunit CbiE [Magnetococcales bacterium]MBF0631700.1 precorrin-6y C5,15-methyltransferase (decarboxylating) subunit C
MTAAIRILGVLDNGPESLTPMAKSWLEGADLVLGEARFLELYASLMAKSAEKRPFSGKIVQVPLWLEEARGLGRQVVVLATGDPLFFGLAGYLAQKLPPGSFEVQCQVSSMQLAFARLARPWSEARWLSVHARDGGDWHPRADFDHPLYPLWRALNQASLLGVLTSPANNPARLARMLVALGLEHAWTMTVCQRLGMADETIEREVNLLQGGERVFLDPNVVILEQRGPSPYERWPKFGLPDEVFQKKVFKKGLITRREVRAIALAYMEIIDGEIVWDIGAGSGSVGLEAAALTPGGQVWSIEKNADSVDHILANRARLGRYNHRIQCGIAPNGLEHWPDPDAVFIGGSGGALESLIGLVLERLRNRGRLVINLVTLEHLTRTLACLDRLGQSWRLTQTGCAIGQPLLHLHRLEAQAPVWIITVIKESGSS